MQLLVTFPESMSPMNSVTDLICAERRVLARVNSAAMKYSPSFSLSRYIFCARTVLSSARYSANVSLPRVASGVLKRRASSDMVITVIVCGRRLEFVFFQPV